MYHVECSQFHFVCDTILITICRLDYAIYALTSISFFFVLYTANSCTVLYVLRFSELSIRGSFNSQRSVAFVFDSLEGCERLWSKKSQCGLDWAQITIVESTLNQTKGGWMKGKGVCHVRPCYSFSLCSFWAIDFFYSKRMQRNLILFNFVWFNSFRFVNSFFTHFFILSFACFNKKKSQLIFFLYNQLFFYFFCRTLVI